MLQVITFDTWAIPAREYIYKYKGFAAVYFLLLVVLVGFFLLSVFVGIITNEVQGFIESFFT